LSIDADVAMTGQPYVFTNDDPLNAEDPLGLAGVPVFLQKQLCGKKGCSGGDLSGFISSTVKTLVIDPVKSGVHLAADVVKNKVVREIATVGIGALAAGVTVTALVLASPELAVTGAIVGFYAVATDSSSCFKGNRAACVGGALGGLSELGGLFPNNAFVGGFSANVGIGATVTDLTFLFVGRKN
jgi:hypothetical protein